MSNQEAVDAAAQRALRHLGPIPNNWVESTDGVEHDVVVIGGGQSGLAIAFGVRNAGIANVAVLDAAEGDSVGVWRTRARMQTLRTPKTRPGPELGIPELSFQAWYEGLHGQQAWEDIGRIARVDWADYLDWFQRQIGIDVRYRTRLVDIEPINGHFRLSIAHDGVSSHEHSRKVIFANGVEGTGGPYLPQQFEGLSTSVHAHAGQPDIPYDSLVGKTIGILGAAASALDAAATALEAGAREVHLFSYRSELVIQPTAGFAPNPALQDNFHRRDDDFRWNARWQMNASGSSSPLDSALRAAQLAGFYLHLDAPWIAARELEGKVVVESQDGTFTFDYVIAGTGYQYDPATRAELKRIAPNVALWRDRYEPPLDKQSSSLGLFPYVGSAYELTEKEPGSAPWLRNIHVFNAAASLSFGRPVGDIPSLRAGVPRLVERVVSDLFFDDLARPKPARTAPPAESHVASYAHAIWRAANQFDEDRTFSPASVR